MTTRTVRIRVEGKVQGVFYRAWTEENAIALNLTGWVRNRRDGSVELLLQGSNEAVAEMLKRCQTGPPASRVTHIETSNEKTKGTFKEFTVRATV